MPALVGPPVSIASQPVTYNEAAVTQSVAAAVATDPPTANKRDLEHFALEGRDVNDPCSPQPGGQGPKPPNDTDSAFLSYSVFSVSLAPATIIHHDLRLASKQHRMRLLLKATS